MIQHFTKTLDASPGVDFRLPTEEELDALEAFQLSLGRQEDLALPLPLKGTVAEARPGDLPRRPARQVQHLPPQRRRQRDTRRQDVGNANFNTGVEDLPDQPARLTGERVPRGRRLRHARATARSTRRRWWRPPTPGPFFHNNAVETIEGAVAFYNGEAFNNSPSGRFLASTTRTASGIGLDAHADRRGRRVPAGDQRAREHPAVDRAAAGRARALGFFERAEATEAAAARGRSET